MSETIPEGTLVLSRFNSDFMMERTLGKGAFGQVFKARNKLDSNTYAVKRMVLNQNNPNNLKKILLEVQLLSQMHHMNIVRYYQAWTENISPQELGEIQKEMSDDSQLDQEHETDEIPVLEAEKNKNTKTNKVQIIKQFDAINMNKTLSPKKDELTKTKERQKSVTKQSLCDSDIYGTNHNTNSKQNMKGNFNSENISHAEGNQQSNKVDQQHNNKKFEEFREAEVNHNVKTQDNQIVVETLHRIQENNY